MSTSKEQQIIEEARKYVDAVRCFDDASRYLNSIRVLGIAQLINAKGEDKRKEISEEQQEKVRHSIAEGQRRISPSILALNGLVEASDEPVYFDHEGWNLMVVPYNTSDPGRKFDVRPKGGGPETSVQRVGLP